MPEFCFSLAWTWLTRSVCKQKTFYVKREFKLLSARALLGRKCIKNIRNEESADSISFVKKASKSDFIDYSVLQRNSNYKVVNAYSVSQVCLKKVKAYCTLKF